MSGKVSIIIPVYAVEEYLPACVSSIVTQTYSNLEIILVDDGSPDRCPNICEEWAKRDKRICVVHKQNGGPASARNAGMSVMTGDMFMFVDSDDYIDTDTVQRMIDSLENSGADIVCIGSRKVFSDTDSTEPDRYVPGEYKCEEAIKHLLLWDGAVRSVPWGKLYRTDLAGDLRFIEELKYGEDTPFVYKAIARSKRICQLPDIKYNYLQRSDSLTGNTYSRKKLLTIKAAQIVSEQCKKDFPELSDYADYHIAMDCYIVLGGLMLAQAEKKFPEDCRFLRETMKQYPARLIVQKSSWKRGIFYEMAWRFPKVYRLKAAIKKFKGDSIKIIIC